MILSFNTTGPCIPAEHYMIPPERRLGRLLKLIDSRKFFTLTAGRQTGKTTSLMWLRTYLNAMGKQRALSVDIQMAQEKPDTAVVMTIILQMLQKTLEVQLPDHPRLTQADVETMLRVPDTALYTYLSRLAALDSRPLVVMFDESDGLVGAAMVSFLSQLRAGYLERSERPFPSSVMLVGQRQVRDYALAQEERSTVLWLGTSSPFNVTAESTTLVPFTPAEVEELLTQHTTATGQRFEPEAVARIVELGCGHPWLTNAMANQIVDMDVEDRHIAITAAHVDAAKETIILDRRTHIDSLMARLREPRVRKIIEPMLAGNKTGDDVLDDDFSYVVGLGLLRLFRGRYEIANPVYREVIPRVLSFAQQTQINNESAWYVRKDGSLDMGKLMVDWQEFWREDGHLAAEGFLYREAGPHLMLMAFLQRIVNGGGRIEREYGLGRGSLDLLVFWKNDRHLIELKIRRGPKTETIALKQMVRYLDQAGLGEGWLVLFDKRKLRWDRKIFVRDVQHEGKTIRIVGC